MQPSHFLGTCSQNSTKKQTNKHPHKHKQTHPHKNKQCGHIINKIFFVDFAFIFRTVFVSNHHTIYTCSQNSANKQTHKQANNVDMYLMIKICTLISNDIILSLNWFYTKHLMLSYLQWFNTSPCYNALTPTQHVFGTVVNVHTTRNSMQNILPF